MMPGKTQTLTTVTLLAAAIFLTVFVIPAFMTCVVHAEDGQPEDKIYPWLEKQISNMKPTDGITVFVHLKEMDADTAAEIEKVTASEKQASEEIKEEVRCRYKAAWEEFEKEFGCEAQELLRAKDTTAVNRYQEIMEKYGADKESVTPLHLEIDKLWEAKESKASAIKEQHYPEIFARATLAIEALSDTKVIGVGKHRSPDNWSPDTPLVRTKVGNITALAEIPDITGIESMSTGNMSVYLYERPDLSWYHPYHPTLLSPGNGYIGYTASQPSFAWKTFKESTKYKFVLAEHADMTQIVTEAEVIATSYEYDGTLDYRTNYFWRVMALEPAPSDWSATFSFQTEAAPPPPQEAPPQPTAWHPALIAGLIIALAGAIGFATWFFVARSHKTK